MSADRPPLETHIAALERQRGLLGDAVVDAAVAALRLQRVQQVDDAPAAVVVPTLRQASVLFLDIVGSTHLSQSLDPESIGAVIDGALSRGTALVERHGGRVLQYAGDSLLAVFGADRAREDDAERAVRCGLALATLGKADEHGGFDVRVGIHTGRVLLGGGVDEADSIRGIAVNIAARLEQAAAPGTLRISDDTHALVRGLFDVVAQEPLRVKGVDAPLRSQLVVRARPRAFRGATRGVEGVATRMIGREAELDRLKDAFVRILGPGAGFARIDVVAEAGVGKSRLLDEFRRWTATRDDGVGVLEARAVPQTQGQAYGLLRDLLAARCGIGDADAMARAKAKLEAGLMPLFAQDDDAGEAEANVHVVGRLIGLDYDDSVRVRGIGDDPRQLRDRGFHAVARALGRIGAAVVIYLDDLHWADDPSLDFLDVLARVDRDVPMLLVALARPTLFERRPAPRPDDASRIVLHPLDAAGSRKMVDELLKELSEPPPSLRDLVADRADGNPFYIEELIRMLIDRKAIDATASPWTFDAARLGALDVPSTLTGVLQARLDGLPSNERRALQLASVIGPTFWDAALAYVDADAVERLPALSRRALVVAGEADHRIDDIGAYAFCHPLFHRVTYDTVLKDVRRGAHARVARWLAEHSGIHARALSGAAAEHFERAGDAGRAAEFHARAAEHATRTFANDAALEHASRALALAGTDDLALRWRAEGCRERVHDLLGQRGGQAASIDALTALADALDDDHRRAQAALRRANVAHRTGDYAAAADEGRRAGSLARSAGDAELELLAARLQAIALAYLGEPDAGRAIAEVALGRAAALGLDIAECQLCNALAICAEEAGRRGALRRYTERGLALTRKLGDRRMEAIALNNLGGTLVLLGDFAAGRGPLEEALSISRAIGHRLLEGVLSVTLSDVALHFDEAAHALSLAEAGVAIAIETGARLHSVEAFDSLGNAAAALGRLDDAEAAFASSEACARELDRSAGVLRALAARIRVAMARDDLARAQDCATALLDVAGLDPASSGADAAILDEDARVRLALHRLWSRLGDPRADAVLADAHRVLMREADAIDDAASRECFLANVADHREIVRLVAERRNAVTGPDAPGRFPADSSHDGQLRR